MLESAHHEDDPRDWLERPLAELVAHIVEDYHRPLQEELPKLTSLIEKVHARHTDGQAERIRSLRDAALTFFSLLRTHLKKEEEVIFPWIVETDGQDASVPVFVAQHEHQALDAGVLAIEELTEHFAAPPVADPDWSDLVRRLQRLVADLKVHNRLEEEALFPRVVGT